MPRPKRKIVQEPKGKKGRDFMSEKGITVKSRKINKGRITNIPSVFGGKIRTEREAIKRIHQSGGVDPENPKRGKIKPIAESKNRKETTTQKFKRGAKESMKRSAGLNKTRSRDILKARLRGKGTSKSKSSRK